jgi:hypothetical protein
MSTDIEMLNEHAKDMRFLVYCLIVVMLIPLGFLSIITISDDLSPGDAEEVIEDEEPVDDEGTIEDTETEDTQADAETSWIVLDIESFA